jgi:HlyD family secretion protein
LKADFVEQTYNREARNAQAGGASEVLRSLQIAQEQRAGESIRKRISHVRLWVAMIALVAFAVSAAAALFARRSRPIPVQVATLGLDGSISGSHLKAGGYVRDARIVNVVARVTGVVATLRVGEGDVVKEGDVIATLDRGDLEKQVVESRADFVASQARLAELRAGQRPEEIGSARAKVEALRATAERLEREKLRSQVLAEAGALAPQAREGAESDSQVAGKNLEAAEQSLALLRAGARPETIAAARASVDAARARLAHISASLSRTQIRAPMSGRVLRKFVDVGTVVSFGMPFTEGYTTLGPGTPIVSIGQLDDLEAVTDINQADLGRLSLGDRVEVSADAFPGKTYQAQVSRFAPRADRNKNTIEVTVRFDSPTPTELAHDLSVKLSFLGERQETHPRALRVPATAIVQQGGTTSVFVVETNRVHLRQIEVGTRLPNRQVPVKDGLVPGDVVVISNPQALKDGQEVVVTIAN